MGLAICLNVVSSQTFFREIPASSLALSMAITRSHCVILYCIIFFSYIILYCNFLFLFLLLKVLVCLSYSSHPTRLASLLSGGNYTVLQLFVNIIISD